jgi:hypothetical protein
MSESDYVPWYWTWWHNYGYTKHGGKKGKEEKAVDAVRCHKRKLPVEDPNHPGKPNPTQPPADVTPMRFSKVEYLQDAFTEVPGSREEYWVWCEGEGCPNDKCTLHPILLRLPSGRYVTDFKCHRLLKKAASKPKAVKKASKKHPTASPKLPKSPQP